MSDVGASPKIDPTSNPGDPPLLFITRFSYLGRSGWKSDSSKDVQLLFAPDRLARRLRLFQQITLPTLVAQTDPDFHHYVLSSTEMPVPAQQQLTQVCKAALGDRCSVEFQPPGPARKHLRQFMVRKYANGPVAQIVLDDDDGLSCDFVACLRTDIQALSQKDEWPFFISYSGGYGLVHGKEVAKLFAHNYPFINLGLTMVSTVSAKNILAIAHKKAPRKSPHIHRRSPRMFIRSVHEDNDSRVDVGPRWIAQLDWQTDTEITERFPYLCAFAVP